MDTGVRAMIDVLSHRGGQDSMVNGTKNFIRTLVLDRPDSTVEDIIDQLQRKGRCPSRLAVASVRRDFVETMTLLHDRRLIDGGWKAGKPSYRWPCKGADRPQAKERRKIGDEAWSKRRPNSRWYFPSERERRRAAQNEGMLAVNERRRQLTVHSKFDLS